MVWIPLEGTTHRPSSERSLILPRSPRNRVNGESATATPRLMNDCFEKLNAYRIFVTYAVSSLPGFSVEPLAKAGASIGSFFAPLDDDHHEEGTNHTCDNPNH